MSTIYRSRKVIYAPNDPFFNEGNIALRSIWLQKEAHSQDEINAIKEEETQLVGTCSVEMYCDRCHINFPNVTAYERHYEAKHKNVCIECYKVFPGAEWLKLHIDEHHNTILYLKRKQGEKIYRCFVTLCKKSFSTNHMRRLHLIDKHHYPKDFPFDLPKTGTLSVKERRRRESIKRKQKEKQAKSQINNDMPIEKTTKQQSSSKAESTQGVDTAMEELSANMAKLKLPQSISFGRRPAGAMYHRHYHKQSTQELVKQEDQQDVEMKTTRRPRKRGPKKKKISKQEDMEEN